MIGIIDYGMGNLYSVSKALERLDYEYIVSDDTEELKRAKGLLLPGVGSFRDAMAILREKGLTDYIKAEAANGKPLLGICLGMQLLFEESDENGLTEGLSFLQGKAVRFPGVTSDGLRYKVPHMGWNKLEFHNEAHPLLEDVQAGHVYFVHSYYIDTADREVVLASSGYDVQVPAVVGKGNVYGTQFHPEKSSEIGMSILKNFAAIVEGEK